MERRHIIFHGRVQGVGFRITFYQQACKMHLTGWVRNLSDGSVEVCVQGESENIEKVIHYMKSIRYIKIDRMDEEMIEVLNDEKSFEMKY